MIITVIVVAIATRRLLLPLARSHLPLPLLALFLLLRLLLLRGGGLRLAPTRGNRLHVIRRGVLRPPARIKVVALLLAHGAPAAPPAPPVALDPSDFVVVFQTPLLVFRSTFRLFSLHCAGDDFALEVGTPQLVFERRGPQHLVGHFDGPLGKRF